MATAAIDRFMQAYLEGMPDSLESVPGAARRRRRLPGVARAMPAEAVALGGVVITPDGPLDGWVTINGSTIAAIGATKPTDAQPIPTGGVIMPGLLDLHGHPEFNVFAPWEPPKTYVNRYSWRASKPYHSLVRDPQNALVGELPTGTQLRYAEIRALVGGVTAIQGASLTTQGKYESMVRNVDGNIFGEHRARALIDLPSSLTSRGGPQMKRVLDAISAGDVDAHYIHLAEGKRDNERSQKEFDQLVSLGALTAATVIIHGTALTREQFGQAKDAGARLVWSPQSNLRLYGETTAAADALDVGLPMALGADWLPSGSLSLLAEMTVAREELRNQGHPVSAREMVTMVTSGAAAVAGLEDKLGSLKVGRVADLVVLEQRDDDAYESVCQCTPAEVQLVVIGGDVVYGRDEFVVVLVGEDGSQRYEPVRAWGQRMLLDTGYVVNSAPTPAPTLSAIRQSLTSVYPQVGPIWA